MRTSDQGIALIEAREGKRNTAYRDTQGIWTIGVGHTGPEVHEGLVWTDAQVLAALTKDLQWTEAAINHGVKGALEQHQFDALSSFVFNVGQVAFAGSTLLRLINAGDILGAAAQFDRWNIPPEIIGRRMAEKAQFLGTAYVARKEAA